MLMDTLPLIPTAIGHTYVQFRFNVREVEMGTRRPLIVQMYHDPTAIEPRCRLQDEDTEEYGPLIQVGKEIVWARCFRTI